jgi:hypothetical protein
VRRLRCGRILFVVRATSVVIAALALLPACGSTSANESRAQEEALRRGLGILRGADVRCRDNACTVIASVQLSTAYTALLMAAPVVETTITDPVLDAVETINVTLDDAGKQQVFSLRCETNKLGRSATATSLRNGCHSIFT